MSKLVLALTGPIASGKGTVKEYIVKKYGAEECRFSSILRDVLDRINIEHTRENISNLSTILRKLFGEDVLAKAMSKDIEKLNSDIIVVDGVRRMEDITFMKDMLGFVLVKVDVSPKIRYERLVGRGENTDDATKTYEQFVADHSFETETTIQEVMDSATASIINDGSLEDLHKQIDILVKKLLR